MSYNAKILTMILTMMITTTVAFTACVDLVTPDQIRDAGSTQRWCIFSHLFCRSPLPPPNLITWSLDELVTWWHLRRIRVTGSAQRWCITQLFCKSHGTLSVHFFLSCWWHICFWSQRKIQIKSLFKIGKSGFPRICWPCYSGSESLDPLMHVHVTCFKEQSGHKLISLSS